jgi:hypothetical protein
MPIVHLKKSHVSFPSKSYKNTHARRNYKTICGRDKYAPGSLAFKELFRFYHYLTLRFAKDARLRKVHFNWSILSSLTSD